jgi:hypothetical protein
MIPLSLQRASLLFSEPLSSNEFVKVIEANFHYWRDIDAVKDAFQAATLRASLTGEPQTFCTRVKRADHDPGLEFLTLTWETVSSQVTLKSLE